MKKMRILAAVMLSAATMFSSVAMAAPKTAAKTATKVYVNPIKLEDHHVIDGVFSCTYPLITGAKDSKANTAINANIAEKIYEFTAPFNHTATVGSPFKKVDANIDHANIKGSTSYDVTYNANTILSMILTKTVTVPHTDGTSYTLTRKDGLNYNSEGKVITADTWSNLAKAVNMEDPFSTASLKKSISDALAAKGLTAVKDYEQNLDMAKQNYYLDAETNLHALYMPGFIAPESAGWFDVVLNAKLLK